MALWTHADCISAAKESLAISLSHPHISFKWEEKTENQVCVGVTGSEAQRGTGGGPNPGVIMRSSDKNKKQPREFKASRETMKTAQEEVETV